MVVVGIRKVLFALFAVETVEIGDVDVGVNHKAIRIRYRVFPQPLGGLPVGSFREARLTCRKEALA